MGSVESAWNLTNAKSAGFPIVAPIAPAVREERIFHFVGTYPSCFAFTISVKVK